MNFIIFLTESGGPKQKNMFTRNPFLSISVCKKKKKKKKKKKITPKKKRNKKKKLIKKFKI